MHWQPIETAPKGESVLLYAGKHCPLYCGKQRFGNLGEPQQDVHAWRCDSSGRFATPTYWMPLPVAPGAKCQTCIGHEAVGNILTAEPCHECTQAPALESPSAPAVPAGFALVPIEPTPEIRKATADGWLNCDSKMILNKSAAAYRAGVAAANTKEPA